MVLAPILTSCEGTPNTSLSFSTFFEVVQAEAIAKTMAD
jgi:hypothetical protein